MVNMKNNENIIEFCKDIKNKSNSEIINVLDSLTEEFNETKNIVINLTYKLDEIEGAYSKILEEYNSRNNYGQ
jgi:hypothetical protein